MGALCPGWEHYVSVSHFGKKLSAKFIRKIYPQNLSEKSIRKINPEDLSEKSVRKIYPQNLSAKFIRNPYPHFPQDPVKVVNESHNEAFISIGALA